MKTILIIITWMTHVPLATVEVDQGSEEACFRAKAQFEAGFAQVPGLGYIIECKEEKE